MENPMTDTHKTVQYQLRLSPELREKLRQSAEQQNRSMNADIVARLEDSFEAENRSSLTNLKIIHLPNGNKRYVFGKLVGAFDIDYTQNLTDLKKDVENCLDILRKSKQLKHRLMFLNKNIHIHQGANHIDVVESGVGTLNWVIVEDHWQPPKEN